MTKLKLKVCGTKWNTAEVAKLQPDYLGFIFYEKSPRHFSGEILQLPSGIKKVGVFVNASIEDVAANPSAYGGPFDLVQVISSYHYIYWGSKRANKSMGGSFIILRHLFI